MNFVDCESFPESNSSDILAPCEKNLDDSNNSGNISVRGYLPLIRKDSCSHMHGLTVYWKEGILYGTFLQKTLQNVTYVFYFTQCLTSFSSINNLLFIILYEWFFILFHLT